MTTPSDLEILENLRGIYDQMTATACYRYFGSDYTSEQARRLFDRFTLDDELRRTLDRFCEAAASEFPWAEEQAKAVDAAINQVVALITLAKGHVLANPGNSLAELYRPKVKKNENSLF